LFGNAFTHRRDARVRELDEARPDGSFIIASGGQQGTTLGRHNAVLRVSPDAKTVMVPPTPRQPFLGVIRKPGW
jgi:hypothetical protein